MAAAKPARALENNALSHVDGHGVIIRWVILTAHSSGIRLRQIKNIELEQNSQTQRKNTRIGAGVGHNDKSDRVSIRGGDRRSS